MNAYEKAQSLGLTGTDAEIVAVLKSTGLTVRPIVLAELLFLLNFRGMLTKLVSNNADEKWTGSVLAMKAVIAADPIATAHVDRWLSHITDPRNTHWDTTDAAYSAPFWAMAQAVAGGQGMPSAEDFVAVAALGGGWMFADFTVEQFASSRTEYLAAQQLAADQAAAAQAAQQAAAIRSARIASIGSLDAESIVDSAASLDDAMDAIQAALTAFGGW
jgi:hypothetical protein